MKQPYDIAPLFTGICSEVSVETLQRVKAELENDTSAAMVKMREVVDRNLQQKLENEKETVIA